MLFRSRQTFYYHFQDIYALVEWMYQHDAVELIERNNKAFLQGEVGTRDDWEEVIKALFNYIEEHRNEILSVINSRAMVYFSNFVYEGLRTSIKRVVDLRSKNLNIDEYYKNFISNFYAIAFGGMVQSWLETNGAARMSSQELIHLLNITVSGNIEAALGRAANEKK